MTELTNALSKCLDDDNGEMKIVPFHINLGDMRTDQSPKQRIQDSNRQA